MVIKVQRSIYKNSKIKNNTNTVDDVAVENIAKCKWVSFSTTANCFVFSSFSRRLLSWQHLVTSHTSFLKKCALRMRTDLTETVLYHLQIMEL